MFIDLFVKLVTDIYIVGKKFSVFEERSIKYQDGEYFVEIPSRCDNVNFAFLFSLLFDILATPRVFQVLS